MPEVIARIQAGCANNGTLAQLACKLASPWPATSRQSPERQQSQGHVEDLQANVRDSRLLGLGHIQRLRFSGSQWLARSWWRQNHWDQGSGKDP